MNSLLLSWEADGPIQFTVQKVGKTSNNDAKFCYAPLAVDCNLGMILQLLSLKEQCLVSLGDAVLHPYGKKQVSWGDSCPLAGKEICANTKI